MKSLDPLEGYNLWSRSYHSENNPIKNMSDEFILERLGDLRGRSVLDAGCGTGKLCIASIERGASVVKGIDLSPKMIEQAKKNCPQGNFECIDLLKVNPEKHDVVICGLVLGHIEHLEPALNKLVASLKPKGHLILTDFHPYQTSMNAKRTFRHRWRTFEVKHSLHALDEYFSLLKKLNINITRFKEPTFNANPVIFCIDGVAA